MKYFELQEILSVLFLIISKKIDILRINKEKGKIKQFCTNKISLKIFIFEVSTKQP